MRSLALAEMIESKWMASLSTASKMPCCVDDEEDADDDAGLGRHVVGRTHHVGEDLAGL
jgi:hypothetical protein